MTKDLITLSELKKKYKDEKTFVIPSHILQNVNDKFTKVKHDNSIWSKYDTLGKYIYRYDAELEPSFQIVMPCALIINHKEDKFFVTRNKETNSLQLIFGDTINEDTGSHEIMLKAISNYLISSLDIDPISKAQYIGTVRDKSKDNKIRFIFGLEAKINDVSMIDNNYENLWMNEEDLFENYSNFDTWSKHIIDFLYSQQDKK